MHFLKSHFIALCISLYSTAAISDQTDSDIKLAQIRLAELQISLDKAAQLRFGIPDHEVEISLSTSIFDLWLLAISTPSLGIHGRGIKSEGDLYYIPNVLRAWIEPADHTTFFIDLYGLRLNNTLTNQISFSGSISAHATLPIKTHIAGVPGGFDCLANLKNTPIAGSFILDEIKDFDIGYTLTIEQPNELSIPAVCPIAPPLYILRKDLPVNDFNKPTHGKLSMAIYNEGKIDLPNGSLTYIMSVKNPDLKIVSNYLIFKTDVDVVARQTMHGGQEKY